MSTAYKLSAGIVLGLFLFVPLSTRAAEPTLSVKLHSDDRVLFISHRNLPDGRFVFTNSKGESIRRDVRIYDANGTKRARMPKDMSIGTYTIAVIPSGTDTPVVSASFNVAYNDAPVCKLRASEKVIERGDVVTIRWTSKLADSVSFIEGRGTETHGSERISLHRYGTHKFTANAVGKGGKSSCSALVRVR